MLIHYPVAMIISYWLVVLWDMIGLFSHPVGNVIIPIDDLIFFRGVQTTNQ